MTTDQYKQIHEEIAVLRAATMKNSQEPFWYPFAIATALIATVASITTVLLHYA